MGFLQGFQKALSLKFCIYIYIYMNLSVGLFLVISDVLVYVSQGYHYKGVDFVW